MNQLPPILQYKIFDNFSIFELHTFDKINIFFKDYIKNRLLTCDSILYLAHPNVFKLVYTYFTNDDWYYFYKNYLHLDSDLELQLLNTNLSKSIISITYNTHYNHKIFFINSFFTIYTNLIKYCTHQIALEKILYLLLFNAYMIHYYFSSLYIHLVENYTTIWVKTNTFVKRFQIYDVKFCNHRLYFSVDYSITNKYLFMSKSVYSVYGEYDFKNNTFVNLPDCPLTIYNLIEKCLSIDDQSDSLSDDDSLSDNV